MTMLDLRYVPRARTIAGLALLLLPSPATHLIRGLTPRLEAQASERMRRFPEVPESTAPPAQANPQPQSKPNPQVPAAPSASPALQLSATPPAPALPPSLLQQPAKPAQILFSAGRLTINADNASLGEILNTLATQSGMKIQGLGADERVFGSFGPGSPKDVLSDLLNGTPYNILMVGDLSNGAPDKLILAHTTQTTTSSNPAQAQATPPPADEDDADASDQPRPEPREQIPPGVTRGGASSATATPPQTPKTPQQLFQELLAMRQQQQQQQDQQSK